MQDDKNKSLSDKQLKFIELYFKLNNINDICKQLDIKRPTYYSYLNNELVKAEIDKIRLNILDNTTQYLQNNLQTCSDELLKIIKSDKTTAQVKINAINSVFNNYNKLSEQVDIYNRIDAINKKLAEQEQLINDK